MTHERQAAAVTRSPLLLRARTPAAMRWVIMATFDAAGRPSESTCEQVRAYRSSGFDVLIVDTSPEMSAERHADWEQNATAWFRRVNEGYDFGSFKAGLQHLMRAEGARPSQLDVLFANDSCFGPFVPLGPIIESFDRYPFGERFVFGITDSLHVVHHIQSYWIYFRSDVSALAFDFFLHEMKHAVDRRQAIEMGELALGRFLAASGCRLEAVFPVRATLARLALSNGWFASTAELILRRLLRRWKYNRDADTQCLRYLLRFAEKIQDFNPIVLFGVQLHRTEKCPFLKKSMFRENVYRDPAIHCRDDPATLSNADVVAMLR